MEPKLQIVKQLPKSLKPKTVEAAVLSFIDDSGAKGDKLGIFNQTIETIANATFLGRGGDFWLSEKDGEAIAFIIANITKDIDNRLCYWVNAAWVRQDFRGNPIVKDWWEGVREHAKRCFCRHLVIVSSRGDKSYPRFLKHNLEKYADLLKEDLED